MTPRRRKTSRVEVGWMHPETEEEFRVECSVSPGDPGNLYGPPEKCWPPEAPEIEVLRVLDETTGAERPDLVALVEADWDRIEEAATEEAEESHAAAYEAAEEDRADAERDARRLGW